MMTVQDPQCFHRSNTASAVFHADPFLVASVLLVAGVVGSVLPAVPGGLLSTTGVGYYWWAGGDIAPLAFGLLVVLGLSTVAVDWLGGAVSARVGGASLRATAAAALAGVALAVVAGPLGLVAGVFAVVFALEFRRHGDARRGGRTAAYATAGILVSTAMQLLLTATMLGVFLLVA
jgi:uncharacterized protein YqgC (DUF456 family)